LLFELARVWSGALEPLPDERRHVGVALAGPRYPRHWANADGDLDFYDVKGVVDALCGGFRVTPSYAPAQHPSLHPGRTAEVCVGDTRLGVVGQLHPTIAERFDLGSGPVLVAEIDFDLLVEAREPLLTVQTPSRFPPADRDISFIVDEATSNGDLEPVMLEAAGELLEQLELFDVFRGGAVPAGRKSLAFALRYRSADRTLDDEEVSAAHARVEEAVRRRFGAEVRGRG
jgi:phenylalanyl-tRNA synthetase beta chain